MSYICYKYTLHTPRYDSNISGITMCHYSIRGSRHVLCISICTVCVTYGTFSCYVYSGMETMAGLRWNALCVQNPVNKLTVSLSENTTVFILLFSYVNSIILIRLPYAWVTYSRLLLITSPRPEVNSNDLYCFTVHFHISISFYQHMHFYCD